MSLLASKCVRCGESTRVFYLDQPTCEGCRSEIEIALAEASEAHRACPADNALLKKEIAHGVIIDRCPVCKGVWLDPGELERVNEEVADEVWRAMAFTRALS